jgi:hypothetical protein
MALYFHFPVSFNAMKLNETHGQRLLGTLELLFPSKFKLLCMYIPPPPMALQPEVGQALIIEASRLHLDNHIQLNYSGRVISPKQRPLPDKTQHSQETDIRAPGGIRILNHSKRTAVDPRLRPRGHSRIYCWHVYIYIYICVLPTSLRLYCFLCTVYTKTEIVKGL